MDINGNRCVICPTGAAITQFRKVEVKRREDRIITLLWSLMWWRFKERKRRSSCSYDSRGPCLIVSPLTSSATKSSHTKIVSPEQSRLWPACCWPQWHRCWCASTGGLHAVSEVSLTALTSWHESQQDLESVNSRFLQYQKPACTLWTPFSPSCLRCMQKHKVSDDGIYDDGNFYTIKWVYIGKLPWDLQITHGCL